MKKKPADPRPTPTTMASAKGDLRQLRTNSSASVAELKAFLQELKGRSPQEMLGVVASSQLVRAIALSCALVFAAIVVFTAIPFVMGGKEEDAAATSTEATPPAPAPVPAADPSPAGDQPSPAPGPDLSTLGVDEAKPAPPNKNPLENQQDDFLKGLD